MKWPCLSVTVKVTFTSSTFFLTTSTLSSSAALAAALEFAGLGAVSGGSGGGSRLSCAESLGGVLAGVFCPRLLSAGCVSAAGCAVLFVLFGAGFGGSGCLGIATADGAEGSSAVEPWAVLWLAGVCAIIEKASNAPAT